MMQSCASAAGSVAAGPIYKSGTKARVGIGAPPPRIVWAARTGDSQQAPSFKVLQSSLVDGTRVHGGADRSARHRLPHAPARQLPGRPVAPPPDQEVPS